jgi:hypothetical protein
MESILQIARKEFHGDLDDVAQFSVVLKFLNKTFRECLIGFRSCDTRTYKIIVERIVSIDLTLISRIASHPSNSLESYKIYGISHEQTLVKSLLNPLTMELVYRRVQKFDHHSPSGHQENPSDGRWRVPARNPFDRIGGDPSPVSSNATGTPQNGFMESNEDYKKWRKENLNLDMNLDVIKSSSIRKIISNLVYIFTIGDKSDEYINRIDKFVYLFCDKTSKHNVLFEAMPTVSKGTIDKVMKLFSGWIENIVFELVSSDEEAFTRPSATTMMIILANDPFTRTDIQRIPEEADEKNIKHRNPYMIYDRPVSSERKLHRNTYAQPY